MTPGHFDSTFTATEVDAAWHIYAALLTYGLQCPAALDNADFADAVELQKGLFDRMFERLEK